MIQIFFGVLVALCASSLQAAQVRLQSRDVRSASVELLPSCTKENLATTTQNAPRTRSASVSEVISLGSPKKEMQQSLSSATSVTATFALMAKLRKQINEYERRYRDPGFLLMQKNKQNDK